MKVIDIKPHIDMTYYPCHYCGCQTKFSLLMEPTGEFTIRKVICTECGATMTLEYGDD